MYHFNQEGKVRNILLSSYLAYIVHSLLAGQTITVNRGLSVFNLLSGRGICHFTPIHNETLLIERRNALLFSLLTLHPHLAGQPGHPTHPIWR